MDRDSGEITLISIIIITRNRYNNLRYCLKSIATQTYANFETIVVDGSNVGRPPNHKLFKKSKAKIFPSHLRNKSLLRNLGSANAKGDIIAFIDDDAIAEPTWLEAIAESFNSPDVVAVGGPTLLVGRQDTLALINRYSALSKIYDRLIAGGRLYDVCRFDGESGFYSIGGSLPESILLDGERDADILSTCNSTVRANAAKSIGGFNSNYILNHEDGDFFLRIRSTGGKIIFNPNAVVFHQPSKIARASPSLMARDFRRFYLEHVKPRSIGGFFRYFMNIVLFNLFWIYKLYQTKNISCLLAPYVFFTGR